MTVLSGHNKSGTGNQSQQMAVFVFKPIIMLSESQVHTDSKNFSGFLFSNIESISKYYIRDPDYRIGFENITLKS